MKHANRRNREVAQERKLFKQIIKKGAVCDIKTLVITLIDFNDTSIKEKWNPASKRHRFHMFFTQSCPACWCRD